MGHDVVVPGSRGDFYIHAAPKGGIGALEC